MVIKKTGTHSSPGFFRFSSPYLFSFDRAGRTCVGASPAIGALVRVDYVDRAALADSVNGAFADTNAACDAAVGNSMSHLLPPEFDC